MEGDMVMRREASTAAAAAAGYQLVTDKYGRTYRWGETPEQLTGHGRWLYIFVPWLAMMVISSFEYAFGTAENTLGKVYHWNLTQLTSILIFWVVFEAGASFPTGWLRERGILPANRAVLLGGIMVLLAYVSLTVDNLAIALFGWIVLGGLGAGMVYSSCINISSKWYPENKGLRTGFINGGFAYGAVPFIFIFSAYFHPDNFRIFLIALGVFFGTLLVVLSFFFRDPPKNWWPPQVDPIAYRDEVERRKELHAHKNPPATRVWTAGEALRTKNMYLLWLNMVTILSVGLFGIALTVPIAQQLGWAGFAAASAGALFALLDGVGRPIAGWISDYLGRRQTMVLVFLTMALSQVGNYFGAVWHNLPLYVIASGIAGLCTGMQFPLFATLTADYYSEATNAQNYGIIYSAKIPGGLVGGIIGSMVVTAVGSEGSFLVGAAVAALAALLVLTHHQPTVEEYERVHARATAPAPGQQAP